MSVWVHKCVSVCEGKRLMSDVLPLTRSTLLFETGSLIGIRSSQIRIGWLAREHRNPPVCFSSARITATFIFRWVLGLNSFFVLCDKHFLPELSYKFLFNFACTSLVSFPFILIHPLPFLLIMHKYWITWSTDFQISFIYKALITQYEYRLICL